MRRPWITVFLALALGLGDHAVAEPEATARPAAVEAARERGRTLAAEGPPWSAGELAGWLALLTVDPRRFAEDEGFRREALPVLLGGLDPEVPAELRDLALLALNDHLGVDFETSERVEATWGAVERPSGGRERPWKEGELRYGHGFASPIEASLYSLPSQLIDAEAAGALLEAVRRLAPEREVLVLGDLEQRRHLGGLVERLGLVWLETFGRAYSPWPRDPLSFTRDSRGAVRLVVRPNVQREREADAGMGREVVQTLPAGLDRAWGGLTWSEAPVPFHNGQVLLTPEAAWISLHGVEERVLELLGEAKVPVASFREATGVDRYLAAVRRAAGELETLYGRPVRFVHPLPESGPPGERAAVMERLGGGAGRDLDLLVTFLPAEDGGLRALVADLTAGSDLLAGLEPLDLETFRRGYDLEPPLGILANRLREAQDTPRARGLDGFLDLVAEHLEKEQIEVRRLPLLVVPTALFADRRGVDYPDFLVGWGNVILERRPDGLRAEGFESLLPEGDERARAIYTAAGADLLLLPTLVRSVVLGGGYRCASAHLRAPADR